MYQTSPKMFSWLLVFAVIDGLFPTFFAIATGAFVGAVPAAIEAGTLDSPEGRHLLWMLFWVGLTFVGSGVPDAFIFAYHNGFRALVSAHRRDRVMRAALAVPGIRHLEDPEYLDALRLATVRDWPDPGAFATAFYRLVTNRVTAISAAFVVGAQFSWLVAIALVITWGIVGFYLRKGQAEGFAAGRSDLRRATYFRNLGFSAVAAKETRIFGLSNWVGDHFTKSWHAVMETVWEFRRRQDLQRYLMLFIIMAVNFISFTLLVDAVADGSVGLAALTAVGQAMLSVTLLALMDDATMAISLGAACFPAIEEVEERAKNDVALKMPGTKPAGDKPVSEIVFENVSFAYPGTGRNIYENLNLRIEAGKSLGIVGANGAGKTTLIKLLARLYDPDNGRIVVDGTPLTELDPLQWQRRVAAIFQDFVHYPYSAADNVGFGHIESRDDRAALEESVELVGAAGIVHALPQQWDTLLSRQFEGGSDLSGGQWQRIALARALFAVKKGAGVLVLDEPTANLDARAEVLLFDRFLDVTRGSTSVLISHRFSTVRRADRIVVIDNGQVVESGTHDELISANGRYAHSFQLQAGRYDDSDLDAEEVN